MRFNGSNSLQWRIGQRLYLLFVVLVVLSAGMVSGTRRAEAQQSEVDLLLGMINDLRAQYGLRAYRLDAALTAAAQAHSEWAASMGTHSHTGRGGTSPTDRAVAAGYGNGRRVWVSENIYWGGLATARSALDWWIQSPIHFAGLTSSQSTDIGIGIAYSNSGGFFTLKFGRISGETAPQPPAPGAAALPTLPVYTVIPVEVAEPREDGSVVHVVQEGQAIWNIAEAYDTAVSEILALNRLTEDSIIQPGDELIIVPAPVKVEETRGPLYHTVEQGQTLWQITLAYGIEFETLLSLNNLSESSIIYPGDTLLIRPGDPTPAPSPDLSLPTAAAQAPTPVFRSETVPGSPAEPGYPAEMVPGMEDKLARGGPITFREIAIGGAATLALAGIVLVGMGSLMLRQHPQPPEEGQDEPPLA